MAEHDFPYDKLILSQGAKPIVPPIPGVDLPNVFTLRDMPDMDRIIAFARLAANRKQQPSSLAADLSAWKWPRRFIVAESHVTVSKNFLISFRCSTPTWPCTLQNRVRSNDFAVMTGSGSQSLQPREASSLPDGEFVPAELILLSVGVRAEVDLAKSAGLEIGVTGGVKVNARMESSDPDIYAVGDAAETTHMLTGARTRIPLAGPANRQGRIAGANAADAHLIYPGALGTSIVRVLHMTAGFTGLNSVQAAKPGFSFFTSMTLRLTTRLLSGLKADADQNLRRRRNRAAARRANRRRRRRRQAHGCFCHGHCRKNDRFRPRSLDLAYSPPFGSANDPVNIAGFVADHIVRGDVVTVSPDNWKPNGEFLLDVREARIDRIRLLQMP